MLQREIIAVDVQAEEVDALCDLLVSLTLVQLTLIQGSC